MTKSSNILSKNSKELFEVRTKFFPPLVFSRLIFEHNKDQDNITLIYAGFGDECKVEDLDSLRTYKFRLTVEIDGSKISTSSDWISITTAKEPFRY